MVEIVYWSGTGNTEAMANEIEAAVKAAGADVESVRFEDTNVDDVASKDVIGTAIVNEMPDNAPECKELGEAAAKA